MPDTQLPELDIVKNELHEQSLRNGRLESLGTLAPVGERDNWTGGISLDRRLDSGEVTESELEHAKHNLSMSYVKISKGAAIRCIDGRLMISYDDNNPEHFGQKLGPQFPGGTPVQAIIYRIALGRNGGPLSDTDLRQDIGKLAEVNQNMGFLPGDHTDDRHPEGKTGCRAIDGVEEHCEKINPVALKELEDTMRTLMGGSFNADHFDHVVATSTRLLSTKESYFMAKEEILAELVSLNPEGAPVLTGVHNEAFVVINMVPGETLNENHFASFTDGKIQAFNYDLGSSFEVAESLFPDKPELRSKYLHARIALALTALMDLTDGSLRLFLRLPNDDQEAAQAA